MKKVEALRFVLITRKTRVQSLIERFNTWPQAKFYLERSEVDVQDYWNEHVNYERQVLETQQTLKQLGRLHVVEREFLPNYQFSPADIVVVIGPDGLVANTLKYLQGQPVIGINPDPERWEGRLLFFEVHDLTRAIQTVVKGHFTNKQVTFAQAITSDGQRLLAVNDLFIGPKSHTTAHYTLNWKNVKERQSSSGVIVSTGFGSTGWLRAVIAGSIGIAGVEQHVMTQGFAWDDQKLQFSVREPFPSQQTGTSLIYGSIIPEEPLCIESHMPESGVIFSDGIESDFLDFNVGSTVKISISEAKGILVC